MLETKFILLFFFNWILKVNFHPVQDKMMSSDNRTWAGLEWNEAFRCAECSLRHPAWQTCRLTPLMLKGGSSTVPSRGYFRRPCWDFKLWHVLGDVCSAGVLVSSRIRKYRDPDCWSQSTVSLWLLIPQSLFFLISHCSTLWKCDAIKHMLWGTSCHLRANRALEQEQHTIRKKRL